MQQRWQRKHSLLRSEVDENDTDSNNNHMAAMVGGEDSAVDGFYCTGKDNPVSDKVSVRTQIADDIW